VQDWGIMVGLTGIFMIAAAFRSESHPYAAGFEVGAMVDATVVV